MTSTDTSQVQRICNAQLPGAWACGVRAVRPTGRAYGFALSRLGVALSALSRLAPADPTRAHVDPGHTATGSEWAPARAST